MTRRPDLVGWTLVAIQFACLGYLAFTGPIIVSAGWLVLEVAGIALGVWAVLTMRLRVNITPSVRRGSSMLEAGPYAWIRHPMYAALIVTGLALVLNFPSASRWVAWGLLTVNLVVKLLYEERLLVAAFPHYAAYQRRTHRLIPWVF